MANSQLVLWAERLPWGIPPSDPSGHEVSWEKRVRRKEEAESKCCVSKGARRWRRPGARRPSLERPPPGVQHTGFLRFSFASAFSTFFHNKCIHFIIFIRKKHKSSVKFQYLKQCSSDSKKKRTHESIKQIIDNAILDLILCTHCVHTSVASSDRMVTFVKKK